MDDLGFIEHPELRWASYHSRVGIADRYAHLHDPARAAPMCTGEPVWAHGEIADARTPTEIPIVCPICKDVYDQFFE